MPAGNTETRLYSVNEEAIVALKRPEVDLLSVPDADWRILKTLASNTQTRHAAGLTNTLLLLPSGTYHRKRLLASRSKLVAHLWSG